MGENAKEQVVSVEGHHEHSHSHGHTHDHVHEHDHEHGHVHSHEHTKAVLNRMARLIGHMQSIRRMVEEGRDCSEVLVQRTEHRNGEQGGGVRDIETESRTPARQNEGTDAGKRGCRYLAPRATP